MPAVSVIIPCFNAARTLPLQLKALFTQLDAPEFEIIVVDNRSTDELSALIARTTAPDGVTLRLVEAHEHVGAAYTRNVGVSEARSDRLMFCDADDAVSQWWIAHGLRTFEEDDLWSGSCIPLSGEQFAQGLDAIRRAIGDNPDWVPPVPENDHTAFPILMGGNFGITRDLMLRLGGFDANAPAGGEDNDLGIRAQQAGSRVITCKATLLGYRQRMDPAALARNASNAARAHAALATRYGLWDRSHFRRWPLDLIRLGPAAARMLTRPRAAREWGALRLRAAVAWSLCRASVRYRLLHRLPQPAVGLGLRKE